MMGVRHSLRRLRSGLRSALFAQSGADTSSEKGSQIIAHTQPRVVGLSELLMPGDDKFVVFFAPEAGVVPHYIAHCVVAKTLEERGHRTLIVRCLNVYPRCVVMDGQSLPLELSAEQRSDVCRMCSRLSSETTGAYSLSVIDLHEILDDEIRSKIRALITSLPVDLSTFEIDGVRLGKICGAEAAVTFKTTDFTGATPEVRSLLVSYLEGALLTYFGMQRLISTGKVARVVHFNEYAILLAAALAAQKAGVPTTNMTMASIRGVDCRRIVFMKESLAIMSYRNRLDQWNNWRSLVLPRATIVAIADDCLFRMSSHSAFVYSPMRTGSIGDLHSLLKLDVNRRLLVAFTSSLDELAANDLYLDALGFDPFPSKQPFDNQIEWLEALIERVESSADLQLVVRVHPREGANRRENLVSDHLWLLRDRFAVRPFEHVRFVWPQDEVSSYDLMELADVGLSAWSSTALEMARFGVPVVSAFDLHVPFPTGDVVAWASTADGYFRCLNEALASAPQLAPISLAYRWSHLRTLGCALDLSDVIPDARVSQLPRYSTPSAALEIEDVLIRDRGVLDITYEKLMHAQGIKAAQDERAALLGQLRRCIWFLFVGEDRSSDYRLFFAKSLDIRVPPGYDAVLVDDGQAIELRTANRTVRRRSPMVRRLATLAAQNVDQVIRHG